MSAKFPNSRASGREPASVLSDEAFCALAQAVTTPILCASAEGRLLFLNEAAQRAFHCSLDKALGQPLADFFSSDLSLPLSADQAGEAVLSVQTREGENFTALLSTAGSNQNGRSLLLCIAQRQGKDPSPEHLLAAFQAVLKARSSEGARALHESQERFLLVTRATNDAVYDWDISSGHIWWNECMKTLFGHNKENAALDIDWWTEQIHAEDREKAFGGLQSVISRRGESWSTEYRFRRADGSYAYVFDRGFIVYRNDKPVRMIGSMMDITARVQAEEELRHGAFHDQLTGLFNRAAFLEELDRAIAHASRRDSYRFAVLFLDLDRFKMVNDSLGHAAGDQLLISVAGRLRECVRPGDVVARLGGDEFTVLLDDLEDERTATDVAKRIISCLRQPFQLSGQETYSGTSIGIAFGGGEKTAQDLLRDADTAMYRAKDSGRGRFHIFDTELREKVLAVLQTENDLRRALERNQLYVEYQPIIELATGSVTGFEALLRWRHPKRGIVSPAEFIPVAEESGLIVPIGWWVLREACSTLADWQKSDSSLANLTMSVNLSTRQIGEPDLVAQVSSALQWSGLRPENLKLEITETAIMANADAAAAVLKLLRDMKVQLYVDDFGTGHSSLGYLHRLPIHALKIDRSFVRDLPENSESRAICSTILTLGRTVGIEVIAEGLESVEQVEQLIELGCVLGQGFYFSRPVNAFAARRYISALEA